MACRDDGIVTLDFANRSPIRLKKINKLHSFEKDETTGSNRP